MQSNQQLYPQKAGPPLGNQLGNGHMHTPFASAFGAVLPPGAKPLTPCYSTPFHGVEIQPSEVCPKNFIIFDQTDQRSQIMFHPAIAHKFSTSALNMYSTYFQDNFCREDVNNEEIEVSSYKEDSDDIDMLLSLEEDEEEEYDEEEVSTARTHGNYGRKSSDSCSSHGCSKPKKKTSSSTMKSSDSCGSYNSDKERQKMKKMIKVLRGIVPGGDQMNTATVLDEAVSYLKSLKVEVQKLGVGNLKN